MALLDDVKSELAAFEGDSPAAIKAQAAAMIRFGGGLRPVQNTYVIQAVFTSLDVAEWLKNTLRNTFGHEAEVNHLTRQTTNGPVETYVVLVTRNVVALALQTGLVDRRKQQVRGLPSEVVNGSIAQIKAAWRGAFMARGFLSDPGKASFLEIACPTEENRRYDLRSPRLSGGTDTLRRERMQLADGAVRLQISGAPPGTRTLGPLIKSQLLYQLS